HGRACTTLCACRCRDGRPGHRRHRVCTSPCACRCLRPVHGLQARTRTRMKQEPAMRAAFSCLLSKRLVIKDWVRSRLGLVSEPVCLHTYLCKPRTGEKVSWQLPCSGGQARPVQNSV